jgi:crotonobetainyl-CoA:carnitine CoA-transferase CaiB-like acyl-CoA transferase
MPARVSAWAIYDIFEVLDGEQVFVAVVSDAQWRSFCEAFDLAQLGADERLRSNRQRVLARQEILAVVRPRFKTLSKAQLIERLAGAGLPFAPISRPEELFDDPHLLASHGLASTHLPDGRTTQLPLLPIEMAARRPSRGATLAAAGEHTASLLHTLGVSEAEQGALEAAGVIRKHY